MPRSPHKRLEMSPQAINEQLYRQHWPTHYQFTEVIEGYAGHRPRAPVSNHLGSGADSWCHSPPRPSSAGQLKGNDCNPCSVKLLSHGRGMYVP